jgi:phenylpropionate dioxygenase-like ring-hydroxylating dioxygenase large terminal subunit
MQPTDIAPVVRPGDWVDTAPGLDDMDFSRHMMRIPTDRYTSRELAERERERIWMRVWQVVGRVDELPEGGDWKEYRIYDQSFLVVRGKDRELRGFVNACRHRGNVLCREPSGNTGSRFVCPYHLWSYDLEGALRGVSRPDLVGDLDKGELGLLPVSVDTFAGFVFLNPDPDAPPLADFLGPDAAEMIAPYHLDEMVTVLDVREAIDCNWKVVVDAFQEGYHIQAIHPELLQIVVIDPRTNRFRFWGDHEVACAPFAVPDATPEAELEGLRTLPDTFPTVTGYLPRLEELVDGYRDAEGLIEYPPGVTGRTLLQQATRETLTDLGLDVTALTDAQMTDNHGWLLFPSFFMTVRAAEATVITAVPHADGDPNRCIWHIRSFMWLPEEYRDDFRTTPVEVDEPNSYPYFRALQQDYEQMPRQQVGLRNRRLEHLNLVREEISVARFHTVLGRWLGDEVASR